MVVVVAAAVVYCSCYCCTTPHWIVAAVAAQQSLMVVDIQKDECPMEAHDIPHVPYLSYITVGRLYRESKDVLKATGLMVFIVWIGCDALFLSLKKTIQTGVHVIHQSHHLILWNRMTM